MVEAPLIAEVVEIVREVGKLPPETIVEAQTCLVDDLGIDSLDLVGMLLQIQDRFGVVIDDDDVANLRRVGDLATCVANHRAA